MAKKQEKPKVSKQRKVWYAVDEIQDASTDNDNVFIISNSLEEAYKDLIEDRGEYLDKNGKLYAFKIELLGEVENTIKIK